MVASDPAVVRYFDVGIKLRGVAVLSLGLSSAIDLISELEHMPPALDEFVDDEITEERDVTICGLGEQRRPARVP